MIKVLTLTQPWASLVAVGAKKIETRSWYTKYRGPLLIHAAAGLKPVGGEIGLFGLCGQEPFLLALLPSYGHVHGHRMIDTHRLPFGAIVAEVFLEDVLPIDVPVADRLWTNLEHCINPNDPNDLTDQERAFGDYTPGRYAWLLADVRPLREPIPCKGALGLWDYDGELPL